MPHEMPGRCCTTPSVVPQPGGKGKLLLFSPVLIRWQHRGVFVVHGTRACMPHAAGPPPLQAGGLAGFAGAAAMSPRWWWCGCLVYLARMHKDNNNNQRDGAQCPHHVHYTAAAGRAWSGPGQAGVAFFGCTRPR